MRLLHWFWDRKDLIDALAKALNEANDATHDAAFWKADSDASTDRNLKLSAAIAALKDVVRRCRDERDEAVKALEECECKSCCRCLRSTS